MQLNKMQQNPKRLLLKLFDLIGEMQCGMNGENFIQWCGLKKTIYLNILIFTKLKISNRS